MSVLSQTVGTSLGWAGGLSCVQALPGGTATFAKFSSAAALRGEGWGCCASRGGPAMPLRAMLSPLHLLLPHPYGIVGK